MYAWCLCDSKCECGTWHQNDLNHDFQKPMLVVWLQKKHREERRKATKKAMPPEIQMNDNTDCSSSYLKCNLV